MLDKEKEIEQQNEDALLKLLSVNARASLQEIAATLHMSKSSTYALLEKTIEKYGLRFFPEISLENLWRMEFARQARSQTKRGIIGEATEIMANAGFNEYALRIKFEGKRPESKELANALGNSHMVLFAAPCKGACDFFAYLVSRTYEDVKYLLGKFNAKLSNYSMIEDVSRIWTSHGFFPASTELVSQFNLFDSYKNLLLGLMKNGRAAFSEIGAECGQGSTQMLYAYERLARTGVLKRMTYIETAPERSAAVIAQLSISNSKLFESSKEKWYEDMVSQNSRECAYSYIADTLSPLGIIAIISAKNRKEVDSEMRKLASLRGAHATFARIESTLLGNIAVRNFDMRYSDMYAYLESRNKVKRLTPSEQRIVETPNQIAGAEEGLGQAPLTSQLTS
ncbi:MAG: AsnC family protein [Candidatus Micrarchaeaceae archaeon]